MLGIAILLGFNFLGILIKELIHLPLPANVIGLILFTASLYSGIIKLAWVEASAQFMTKHMMVFFLPFLIGTMPFFPFIGTHFFSIIISLFASTFIVLAVTGWITMRLSKKEEPGERQRVDLGEQQRIEPGEKQRVYSGAQQYVEPGEHLT